jgi:hypothetical protein
VSPLSTLLPFLERLAAGPMLRPSLGGTAPTATPPGGTGGGGGSGEAPTTPELYASYLVLLSAAVFAVIGFWQGMRRSFTAFLFTAGAAFILSTRWDLVAGMVNRVWRLVLFALKGGPLAADPAAAWGAVKDLPGLVPTTGPAVGLWQLTFFAAAVLTGYLVGFLLFKPPGGGLRLRAVNDWLSRLFGALFGALTGAIIAMFSLPRIVPGAEIDMIGPDSVTRHLLQQYGTVLFWSFVLLMIVAGLLALRPKPSSKVFN